MTIHLKAILSSTFQWCCLLMLVKVIQTFVSVDEILQYHTIHLKAIEQYVLSCGTVHYAVQDGSNF